MPTPNARARLDARAFLLGMGFAVACSWAASGPEQTNPPPPAPGGRVVDELSPEFFRRWKSWVSVVGNGSVPRYQQLPDAGIKLDYLPPPLGHRAAPGSRFNPGASGPGVSPDEHAPVLGGLLDPRTGWPFVIGFHFQPRTGLRQQFWIVNSYQAKQEMSIEPPGDGLVVQGLNAEGLLEERRLEELVAATKGRPVFIQVHGSLTYFDAAMAGGLWSRAWLTFHRALPPDAVFIIFDWPSWRVYPDDVRDINEKGRRAYIAGLHLAQFVEKLPEGSRVCLLGQSYGGRVVLSALHLLGGGELDSQSNDAPVKLPGPRRHQQLRAVILAAAADHDWLNPGARLERAPHAAERLLNLYNSGDEALLFYPLLQRSGRKQAIGLLGWTDEDLDSLSALSDRLEQANTFDDLGTAHTLLEAMSHAKIAQLIAPLAWANDGRPAGAEDRPPALTGAPGDLKSPMAPPSR